MLTPEMLESIRQHFPQHGVEIFSSSEWGSENPQYRVLLRGFLKDHLKERVSFDELKNLDNLEIPPRFKFLFCSVSHTKNMGIVALAKSPLGIDLEETARIFPKTVARVSSNQEVDEAPSMAHLWCAKEAAYKSLQYFTQPSVISAVAIGGWQKIDSQTETFRLVSAGNFNAPRNSLGICLQNKCWTLAFFGVFS